MMDFNRQQTMPIKVPRSRRNHAVNVLTSMPAGKVVPLAVIPMLREDSAVVRARAQFELMETHEILMNRVNCRIMAWAVPWLAMERFEGSRDQFDRSYMGEAQVDGGSVVPFIETHEYGTFGANAVYKALGLHGESLQDVNTMYLEAYNLIWNFRAKNRSLGIAARNRLETTLAPAFWMHTRFGQVLPSFDQSVIEGEMALNVIQNQLALKGLDLTDGYDATRGRVRTYREHTPATIVSLDNPGGASTDVVVSSGNPGASTKLRQYVDLAEVVAELADGGVTVSLANLELAKKTQAFAKMRQRYDGLGDEYLIDMLMDGLTLPDQQLKQPICIHDEVVPFGQAKRYATDSANLAESAVSGGLVHDMRLRVPRISTGAVIVITAEVVPEQLYERQRDAFFCTEDVSALPQFLRDHLDTQKVDEVLNKEIDSHHSDPNTLFGYAPLNWKWNAGGPKVGGKFMRPNSGTSNDVERERIWGAETSNPTLSTDFYLVSSINLKPFLNTTADPVEVVLSGGAVLEGTSQFGGTLIEATDNYEKVLDKAPDQSEQIDQDA